MPPRRTTLLGQLLLHGRDTMAESLLCIYPRPQAIYSQHNFQKHIHSVYHILIRCHLGLQVLKTMS